MGSSERQKGALLISQKSIKTHQVRPTNALLHTNCFCSNTLPTLDWTITGFLQSLTTDFWNYQPKPQALSQLSFRHLLEIMEKNLKANKWGQKSECKKANPSLSSQTHPNISKGSKEKHFTTRIADKNSLQSRPRTSRASWVRKLPKAVQRVTETPLVWKRKTRFFKCFFGGLVIVVVWKNVPDL